MDSSDTFQFPDDNAFAAEVSKGKKRSQKKVRLMPGELPSKRAKPNEGSPSMQCDLPEYELSLDNGSGNPAAEEESKLLEEITNQVEEEIELNFKRPAKRWLRRWVL